MKDCRHVHLKDEEFKKLEEKVRNLDKKINDLDPKINNTADCVLFLIVLFLIGFGIYKCIQILFKLNFIIFILF